MENLYLNRHITGALVDGSHWGLEAVGTGDKGRGVGVPPPFHGPPGGDGKHGTAGLRARRGYEGCRFHAEKMTRDRSV